MDTRESFVFKIIDNKTGELAGAYSRAYSTEYEFRSPSEARSSNVNGIFKDKRRYHIQKWKVTYELVDDDADPYIQTSIPYYKDYLSNKAHREMFEQVMGKAFSEAFKQFESGFKK